MSPSYRDKLLVSKGGGTRKGTSAFLYLPPYLPAGTLLPSVVGSVLFALPALSPPPPEIPGLCKHRGVSVNRGGHVLSGRRVQSAAGVFVLSNPRYKNGALRRKYRARFKAMGAPCGICGGKLGPIHYDEPSDASHPLSFVIDEIIPVSKAEFYGYKSGGDAAADWNNLQPAHRCCNAVKGAKVGFKFDDYLRKKAGENGESGRCEVKNFSAVATDGDW